MVVVVQLFTAEPDRDRRDVPALVFDLEIPVAERVSDAVDDAGGPERNPHHLDGPDERSDEEAEEVDVEAEHDHDAEPIQATQKDALDPIVRCALAVFLEHARLANRAPIVKG